MFELYIERARTVYRQMPGITAIWRQDCYALSTMAEHFGFRDGISHPAVEGSGIPQSNLLEKPLKAGEFVIGYPDEMGETQKIEPELLGRNGTYIVFRKLQQNVAQFRRYLREMAKDPLHEEMLAAKMMGRWRSGLAYKARKPAGCIDCRSFSPASYDTTRSCLRPSFARRNSRR